MNESTPDPLRTRSSIFLRLNARDREPRELAWSEFRDRYVPVIAHFARKLGARPQDIDDVVQDVLMGFFAVSPRFEYDPSKGRFRGYIRTVTLNAIRSRLGKAARVDAVPLDQIADDAPSLEQVWEQSWREQLLRRALNMVRQDYSAHPGTIQAFELYVLKDLPPGEVAHQLGMNIDSVYQAKHRISEALRVKMQQLRDEEG